YLSERAAVYAGAPPLGEAVSADGEGEQVAPHRGLVAVDVDLHVPVPMPGVALGCRVVPLRVGEQRVAPLVAPAHRAVVRHADALEGAVGCEAGGPGLG